MTQGKNEMYEPIILDRERLIEAQEELCKKEGIPLFVPRNGRCFHCKNDIVNEEWATKHQTGCRVCGTSYCE
jgi:hypothetical protein